MAYRYPIVHHNDAQPPKNDVNQILSLIRSPVAFTHPASGMTRARTSPDNARRMKRRRVYLSFGWLWVVGVFLCIQLVPHGPMFINCLIKILLSQQEVISLCIALMSSAEIFWRYPAATPFLVYLSDCAGLNIRVPVALLILFTFPIVVSPRGLRPGFLRVQQATEPIPHSPL